MASVLLLPYEDGSVLKFVSGFVAVLGIIVVTLFWRKDNKFLLGFFVLAFAFGIFWYQRDISSDIQAKIYTKEFAKDIQGVIIDEPELKNDKASYVLYVPDCCKVLIQASRYPEYGYGDEVLIRGDVREPENFDEDFDYRAYLAKDDIYLIVKNPEMKLIAKDKGSPVFGYLYRLKHRLESVYQDNLPEPHASLLAGITLGSRSGLSEDVLEDFKETGTMHIVALSGYNISIIAWFVMGILIYFTVSRGISFWISVLMITVFVFMTGASASVVRAAVMGILILVARQQGRMHTASNALIFAGALMVFINPRILRFDVGFQLSFLATLGLIVLHPRLNDRLRNVTKLLGVKEVLIATIAAQIFVLPLIFYQFGTISWISPIVNVLILPAVPIAMFLGFLGSFMGLIFAPLAKIFLWPAWLFLEWVLRVVEIF